MPDQTPTRPNIEDVALARRRLDGVALRTPVIVSRLIDGVAGRSVFIKAECFQRTGSFKFRGAYNRLSTLSGQERAAGVAAASSGNHAQALARGAQLLGCRAVVLMPRYAPPAKLHAVADTYGAEVILYDNPSDREEMLRDLVDSRGLVPVPSSNDRDVIAGQGTVALELFEAVPDIETLVVPVAGGGLLGGCATVARVVSPATRVVGVEPAESPDMKASLHAGRIVPCAPGATIADALALHAPSPLAFSVCHDLLSSADVVLVTNNEILAALRMLWERTKLLVEPAGAVALAAVLANRIPGIGSRVAVIASGGNISSSLVGRLLADS